MAILAPTTEQANRMMKTVNAAAQLDQVYAAAGLVVLASNDCKPVLLGEKMGLVLGHLFTGATPARRVRDFSPDEAKAVHESRGQTLIDTCWGGYVALLTPLGKTALTIVRDPSGAMPCYHLTLDDSTKVLVSDVETLVESGLCLPDVDVPAVVNLLLAYDLRSPRTCLKGLHEVPAGHRLSVTQQNEALEVCWTPAPHVVADPQNNKENSAARVLAITSGVVQAWAEVFDYPLLGVSGGLDSSVIASVLSALPSPFTLLTMTTDEGDGDERHYTRILAEALHVPVLERFHRLDQIDVQHSTSGHLPRPVLLAFGQSEHRQKLEIAMAEGIDAFFTGVGGDNVFCSMHSVLPLIDRMTVEGLGPGIWDTAADLCRLTGCSVQELIRAAAKHLFVSASTRWQLDTSFLSAGIVEAMAPPVEHPWLTADTHIPPGKRQHIAMLTRIQGTIDGFSRFDSPVLVNPLLSQPLMELCLSLPTWLWVSGGRDRALTRAAFADKLPAALLDRRSKGTPNSFAFEVIDRNRNLLREQLLGGILAAQGILDVAAIERALSPGSALVGFDHMRLATLAEAEAWCQLWHARRTHHVRSRFSHAMSS